MVKNRIKCFECDCFLREKTRRNNDFENRMLCYNCYKATGWNYYDLKRKYPEKIREFFKSKNDIKSEKLVNFGKYKGLEYDEVIKKDINYCKWILSKSNENNFGENGFIKYLTLLYNNGTKPTL